MKILKQATYITVLQIRDFQLAGNCKTEFQAPESCKSHAENRLGSKRALEGAGAKPYKTLVFLLFIQKKLSERAK